MDMASIASSMIGQQQSATKASLQAVMMKQNQQQDQAIVGLLAQATQAAPAPGTGLIVDKQA